MSIPPHDPAARRPASGLDPMPGSSPRSDDLPDDVPDPFTPGRPGRRSDLDVPAPGGMAVVGTGRDDRLRHVVDVAWGEVGDPTGLRARCGAPVQQVVPGLGADRADCPACAR